MREFSLGGDGLTIANAAATLVGYLPPAAPTANLENLRMWASQQGSATSGQVRIQVVTQVSAYPTVVTATPRPLKTVDATVSILAGVAGALTAGKCGLNASAEGVMPAGGVSSLGLFAPAALVPLNNWAVGINYGEV